ncbi:Sec-independent protein translocase [Striga asiatica]|uniref:Sec-independent protein translocase n=1 Tax=Striga asiatica TaxID=4170 RepID=A0A5A7Q203_STRAF|nr:Sec-independent protein translocase [Striga asiatica]
MKTWSGRGPNKPGGTSMHSYSGWKWTLKEEFERRAEDKTSYFRKVSLLPGIFPRWKSERVTTPYDEKGISPTLVKCYLKAGFNSTASLIVIIDPKGLVEVREEGWTSGMRNGMTFD